MSHPSLVDVPSERVRRSRRLVHDESLERLRQQVSAAHRGRAWGWRFLIYGLLIILIGVALGACGEAGSGAVAGPKPDCGRVITVPFQDGTGTLTITVFYPDSLKQNCGPASGG